MDYPGPLSISTTESLSPEEAEVEKRFAVSVQEGLEEIIVKYRELHGCVIDTDRAREFSSDYCASPEARTRYSRAVYKPAKALADEIYRREIHSAAPAEGKRILFTSGGTGVGKSTALAVLSQESADEDLYEIVVDGTLSDLVAARYKISEALALGHQVAIVHVHREFCETVSMVVKRAIELGRVVTLDNIAITHFRSVETLLKLAEEFDGRIDIRVIENSTAHSVHAISLDELSLKQPESVDSLRRMAYSTFANECDHLKIQHPEIYEAFLLGGTRS